MTSAGQDGDGAHPEAAATELDGLRRYETMVHTRAADLATWAQRRRDSVAPVDVAFRLYDRDRVAVGGVLGSAVAFRLFLFLVPVLLFMIGVLSLALTGRDPAQFASSTGMGAYVGRQIEDAISRGTTTAWLAILAGLFGAVWAGWSLTKVMIAVATISWGLDVRRRAATSMRVLLAVIGLVTVMMVAAGLVNRIRDAAGLAVGATSLVVAGAVYAAAWFFVFLALPRGTGDPSALLPGAALMALVMAGLQGFSQFYAARALSSATNVYGTFGLTVVYLGWFFFLGRTFVGAAVVNAVVWERFGSIASFVFGLPLVRAVPRRFDVVNRFFDLGIERDSADSTVALGQGERDEPHPGEQR